MRYHYDTEFKDTGSTIEPISLGMIDDNDRELYLINVHAVRAFQERDYFGNLDQTDTWLKENVFNHITEDDLNRYGLGYNKAAELGHLTESFRAQAAQKVYDFICDGLNYGEQAELWGYFAAYDHVLLSQLFGRMIDLPGPMPMFTNELMTIRKRSNGTWKPKPVRPVELPEHHALMDAKYQKLMYEAWS